MKREYLEGLELEKDVIDKVMAENGKDIENAKGDITTKDIEIKNLKGQLKDANKKIDEFKDLDVEGIKKASDDYKLKFEQSEKDAEEKLTKLKYDFGLTNYVNKFEFASERVKKSILDDLKSKEFKLDGETFLGADDYIEKLKKSEPQSFAEDNGEAPPKFTRPGGKPDVGGLTKESFGKMTYMERLALKQKDEVLYKKLNE